MKFTNESKNGLTIISLNKKVRICLSELTSKFGVIVSENNHPIRGHLFDTWDKVKKRFPNSNLSDFDDVAEGWRVIKKL